MSSESKEAAGNTLAASEPTSAGHVKNAGELLAAALDFAAAAMPVLPLAGKVPRTQNGLTGASADLDKVIAWWRKWPTANVGVVTGAASGFVVLDVDGAAGARSLAELERGHGTLRTAEVVTGSGGRHLYFRCPPYLVRNSTGVLGDGLDIRGEGGYVVAPPSKHAKHGSVYAWTRDLEHAVVWPDWLRELAPERNGPAPTVERVIPAGRRNAELVSVAGTMRRRGLEANEILGALRAVNETRCQPPLAEHEVEHIATSVARYKPAVHVGVAPDEPDTRTTSGEPASLSGKVVQVDNPDTTGQRPALALELDILTRLREDLGKSGLAGEQRPAQIIYLCLTSRLLPWGLASNRPVSAIGKGTSSAGKSYTQGAVLRFLPRSAYFDLGSMSKRFLLYSEEGLEHRFVVVPEWALIADDDEIVAALRTLLSEGRLVHGTVDTEGARRVARRIEKDGPTGLLMTTTAPLTDPELETRCLSFTLDDSRAQTGRIFETVADLEEGGAAPVDYEPWHALQHWLVDHGENRVVIPYVRELARLMPTVATRLRRDFVSVLCLVRAHALLHQATRSRDGFGRIVATVTDYAAVHELLDDLVAEGVDASVSPATRDTVETVRALLVNADHTSVKRIADSLEVGRSATYDRVRRALTAGFLVNVAKENERGLKIALGAELPAAGAKFLPDPDDVVQSCPDGAAGQLSGSTVRDSDELSGRPGRRDTPRTDE